MVPPDLAAEPPIRVPGTAVFMYGTADGTPPALVHNLAHNKVLHEKVVFLTVVTHDVPHVPPTERVTVKRMGKGFHAVVARSVGGTRSEEHTSDSSHSQISYAVFCLKKKKQHPTCRASHCFTIHAHA